jgi:hypothetical protein
LREETSLLQFSQNFPRKFTKNERLSEIMDEKREKKDF